MNLSLWKSLKARFQIKTTQLSFRPVKTHIGLPNYFSILFEFQYWILYRAQCMIANQRLLILHYTPGQFHKGFISWNQRIYRPEPTPFQ